LKTYTLIAGVNGVGKSSLTGVLKTERNDLGHIIDFDKYVLTNNSNTLKAGKDIIKRIDYYLANGISFTQETTLSGHYILKNILTAKECGYVVRLFYVGLSSCDESIARIKNRVQKGGHDIAENDVKRRFDKRFSDLKKAIQYCNEAYFFDNENGFVKVAEYLNGELFIKGEYCPAWLDDLKNN
jgi:predicted ABC-type ATPase